VRPAGGEPGRVGTPSEKRVAQEAAEGVFGVRSVVDRVRIDAAGET
jgi:osmotically-inducible protein OsmY